MQKVVIIFTPHKLFTILENEAPEQILAGTIVLLTKYFLRQ